MTVPSQLVAFRGDRRLASGPAAEVAVAVHAAGEGEPVLIFDARTGAPIDLDLRGSAEAVRARHTPAERQARGPGRPKLGVVPREVTLLPRHWDWLAAQPGGASISLRKLVETAMRDPAAEARTARDAAYRLMSALAGDREGFEAASRALFAGDRGEFEARLAAWPDDIADQLREVASAGFPAAA